MLLACKPAYGRHMLGPILRVLWRNHTHTHTHTLRLLYIDLKERKKLFFIKHMTMKGKFNLKISFQNFSFFQLNTKISHGTQNNILNEKKQYFVGAIWSVILQGQGYISQFSILHYLLPKISVALALKFYQFCNSNQPQVEELYSDFPLNTIQCYKLHSNITVPSRMTQKDDFLV